jgi:hypothetical protein
MCLVPVSKSYNCQVTDFPKLLSKNSKSIVTHLSAFHLERVNIVDVGFDVPCGKCALNQSFTDAGL